MGREYKRGDTQASVAGCSIVMELQCFTLELKAWALGPGGLVPNLTLTLTSSVTLGKSLNLSVVYQFPQ